MNRFFLFIYAVMWMVLAMVFGKIVGSTDAAWSFFTAFLVTTTMVVCSKD